MADDTTRDDAPATNDDESRDIATFQSGLAGPTPTGSEIPHAPTGSEIPHTPAPTTDDESPT